MKVRPQFPLLATAAALAATIVAPGFAHAAVPNPVHSYFDPVIVGTPSGDIIQSTNGCTPRDPGFNVIVRDVNNAPIPGSTVTIDFSGAAGTRLRNLQEPGTTLNCATKTISRVTNAQGLVRFAPRFGGHNNGFSVLISADGVILGLVPARSPDVDGFGAPTGLNDFAIFSANFAAQAPTPETDFDVCASGPVGTGLQDFAIFVKEFQQNVSATFCP